MKRILTLLFFLGSIAYGQVNLNQGLIASYPFSGNANDVSGNNINGVVNNAILTTDRFGMPNSAYYFNGLNSFIQLPYSQIYNFAPQDSFSISVRVLPDQGYAWPAQAIVVKSPVHTNYTLSLWNYGIYVLNYKAMGGYAYNNLVNGTTTFTGASCWYNIVMTYKNGIWKLYVNGILESSDLTQTKFILQDGSASKINFGKKGDSNGDYYKGKMDDVRIYNRVLNAAEAVALNNCSNTTTGCENWLRTQAVGQKVTVGDLDISGDKMTIEANFNCSSFPISGSNKWEDIVSKHANTTDANYVLRMDLAAITTTSGHYLTPDPSSCYNLVLNKTYHVALVYDGSTLKLYRNGVVISQRPVSGNLILNNWLTTIGDYAVNNPVGTNFLGYINEVRIWNVARSQSQLQTYMDAPLPNPTTQTGLLGYYTFDNLINKQGNTLYNGTLNGGATINNTNPNCTFTPEQSNIVANAGTDTSFCSSTTVSHTLQGNGTGTYSWTPAAYLNNPTLQNPTATISATTTFYLTVTGASACSAIDSVTIYVNPLPVVQTLIDTAICKSSALILTTNSNASTFQWSPAGYVDNPNISNPNFIGTNSQRMYVTASTGTGCSAIDSVDVTVKPSPLVKTIEDSAICVSSINPITLSTTGALTYSWTPTIFLSNPNIANPVYSGNQSQTYYVTGTGANGCKAIDTVNIIVNSPSSLLAPPDKSMCGNSSVQLDGYNGTSVEYLWSPATYLSNPTIINPVANPPSSMIYSVKITNRGCNFDSTFTVLVKLLPKPIINAGKTNDIDCANRSSILSASGGDTYLWTPAAGLSDPNIPNPVATPATTQQYIVHVSNSSGCFGDDSVIVYKNLAASLARYMPNAFTPNGDGLNDCYGLKNWMYVKKLEFRIFNKYGELLFATSNPANCWDGRYKGKIADQGSYVYYIKAETNCGTEEQKGSFMLLR